MPTPPPADLPPHEPEIEALARVARGGLWLVRRVFWLGGAVAVGYGAFRSGADAHWTFYAPHSLATPPAATGVTWLCVGLPLLAKADWLFGRGRLVALALGGVLWFGAALLPEERDYGFVLRLFASLVACLSLLVWRTLWRLTTPGPTAG